MALTANQQWWIRTDGSASNGGGYDATVSGAGTNYCDQAAAQLTLTDLATTGVVTTLTSVTGGFTAAMIGNVIRIASGTNFTAGYYCITAYTNTNTVTIDRAATTGAGVGGTGSVGGAFASLVSIAGTGNGGLSSPAVTSPLAAGHQVNLRGSGTDNPSSVDYDYKGSASSYQGYFSSNANGSTATGKINVVGYNGRPNVQISGLLFYQIQYWNFSNIKFTFYSAAGFPSYGIFGTVSGGGDTGGSFAISASNLIVDLNGVDGIGLQIDHGRNLCVINSGGGSAGTGSGIGWAGYGQFYGCSVNGVRGDGFYCGGGWAVFNNCVSVNNGRSGFRIVAGSANLASTTTIANCVSYNNTGDGIYLADAITCATVGAYNNILVSNGGYGINFANGSSALNNNRAIFVDYNSFYSNTSGAYASYGGGSHDVTLTGVPFVNASGGNFQLNNTASQGAACRAAGFIGTIENTSSTGYIDIGAYQHQDPAGGSGPVGVAKVIQNIGTY